jgi:CheY-like chemotaxis protein
MNTNPASAGTTQGGRRLAFILDDEPEIRALITHIAETTGFAARAFGRATSLLMALTEAAPEIIILDLSLGDTDGVDVIRSLAASRFGGAILLVSGRHDAKTIQEVWRIGAHHGLTLLPFLQNPFVCMNSGTDCACSTIYPRTYRGRLSLRVRFAIISSNYGISRKLTCGLGGCAVPRP